MTIVFAFGALTIASLLYVFWLTPEEFREKTRDERERDFLGERKEMVYEGLRDLQMEYRMGKLSDEDYQGLKLNFQHQLAGLIEEAEQFEAATGREKTSGSLPKASAPATVFCTQCGRECPPANRFCGACGTALADESETTA